MNRPNILAVALSAIIVAASAGISFAQSTDRDNPTPLTSNEVTGSFIDHQRDNNKENFYSFTAGPGELTIVFDVTRRRQGDMATVNFELLERNGSTSILCCEFAQSGDGGTGRETASVKLARRQTVILHITNASIGGGSFIARLSGAAMSSGGTTGTGGFGDLNPNGRERGRGDDETINVPASGILRIRMKNGTTQNINLNLVRYISVRQS